MIVPENGCKVYIEGFVYDWSCWTAVGSVYPFDYVLTKFKRID